ncbi:MAG: HD domain-containing protein [Candidatus Paceibacterota bacterium]|jgi:HD superfamily phosphodiesterase
MSFDEEKFKQGAEKVILRCRPGDWEHALSAVAWVKKLGEGRSDLPLLISAAYIHDIGWRDVWAKDKITFAELRDLEQLANDNSHQFAKEFLSNLDYDQTEIATIIRLIEAADAHDSKQEDEAIVVDADNLSKLSFEHLKNKFDPGDWVELCEMWQEELPQRVKTEKAKALWPKLLAELKGRVFLELKNYSK